MSDLRDVIRRLCEPVVMPGVRQTLADVLGDEREELAQALAGLLMFEQEQADKAPGQQNLRRSSHLEDIAALLLEEA